MGITQHDIKTVNKLIGSGPVDLGIGAVPAGMKRYVTFINLQNVYGGAQKVWLASTSATTFASTPTLASTAALFTIHLHSANSDFQLPKSSPDYDHPLFSISEDSYLDILGQYGSTQLFLQFYDK